jgi:predicted alpha-1,2-mannosidase
MSFIRQKIKFLPLFMILLVSCLTRETVYIQEVNPLLGTAPITDKAEIGYSPPENWRVWAGLVFPGPALPNALVQLTPVTKYGTGAGYQYEDDRIIGFAHTMKGHWNLGNIPVIPENGLPVPEEMGSSFSHENEKASPGYYEVFLDEDSIQIRLTSTLRCGFHHYLFNPTADATVLFDLGKANNRVDQFEINFESNYQVKGFQQTEEVKVFFYAEFDKEFENAYVSTNNDWEPINNLKKSNIKNHPVAVQFDCMDDPGLMMKIGLSFVNTEQAEKNLRSELPDWNFSEIRKEAEHTWESLLSRIKIQGGSEKERMIFYTSFYRAFLWPALRSDVDGSYVDINGEISKTDRNYYTVPSLWDTFRNKLILLSILDKKLTGDIIQSMIDMGNKSGYMPVFFHGDHAATFISGAYSRGLDNFNVADAYRLLLRNATDTMGPREYLDEYINKGYISTPETSYPTVETKGKAGVAKTLEYAYNDYSLGLFARALGDSLQAKNLSDRSRNYKNVFDHGSGFMRGKLSDGDWVAPFNPEYPYYEYMYREANAWQQTFFVPHDVKGLIKLYGGDRQFENKLDSMFALEWNPEYIARNVCCFIGQYCHGNQPDHHVPYLYYFINKPWKSQMIINQIQSMYGIGLNDLALPGMDDTGEMSSWYVFTSMGFYPFSPADPYYLLSVPKFRSIEISLDNGKILSIQKHSSGADSIIKKVTLNGVEIKDYVLSHDALISGGVIDFYTE